MKVKVKCPYWYCKVSDSRSGGWAKCVDEKEIKELIDKYKEGI